jgi:hypothetical protein
MGPIQQQFFGVNRHIGPLPVAEAIGQWFEHIETSAVGLFSARVGASWPEGNHHAVASGGGGLLYRYTTG